jgi:hypothetical protein
MNFLNKPEWKRLLDHTGIDGCITLQWIYIIRIQVWLELICLRIIPVMDFCEYGNEHQGSTRGVEFDQLRY